MLDRALHVGLQRAGLAKVSRGSRHISEHPLRDWHCS